VAYLWMGIIAGLAASPHCAGMCGAFPLHLARAAGRGRPALRHALYLAGKLFTYAFLGGLAGLLGQRLVASRAVASSQEYLAYVAGAALVVIGLAMLDLVPKPSFVGRDGQGWSFLRQLYAHLFRAPGPWGSFALGVATGFLPCPITLAMLGLAAAGHSVTTGMAILTGLGIGTAPALLGVGLSGTLFVRARQAVPLRRLGLRGAGAVVIALGVITMLRPIGALCRVLPMLDLGHPGAPAETR